MEQLRRLLRPALLGVQVEHPQRFRIQVWRRAEADAGRRALLGGQIFVVHASLDLHLHGGSIGHDHTRNQAQRIVVGGVAVHIFRIFHAGHTELGGFVQPRMDDAEASSLGDLFGGHVHGAGTIRRERIAHGHSGPSLQGRCSVGGGHLGQASCELPDHGTVRRFFIEAAAQQGGQRIGRRLTFAGKHADQGLAHGGPVGIARPRQGRGLSRHQLQEEGTHAVAGCRLTTDPFGRHIGLAIFGDHGLAPGLEDLETGDLDLALHIHEHLPGPWGRVDHPQLCIGLLTTGGAQGLGDRFAQAKGHTDRQALSGVGRKQHTKAGPLEGLVDPAGPILQVLHTLHAKDMGIAEPREHRLFLLEITVRALPQGEGTQRVEQHGLGALARARPLSELCPL